MPRSETPTTVLLVGLGGVSFAAHMLVAGNYGYFRDELYYLAGGRHLQAGYVDHPLLMGWLAALVRVTVGDGLVAIHVVPALACAAIVVVTGLMARGLGGGRVAQLVAGVAALFCLDFMATGSIFSMDVLDQLWWALVSLTVVRLRRDGPRLWLLVGLVGAVALLTKLTILFFGVALVLALMATPERRHLRTPWPWLAGGIALLGLLPYLVWNAAAGWPTVEFYRRYGGVGVSPPAFFAAQLGQMNPIAFPLAAAGLVFYFSRAGARYRLLGWAFVFAYLVLTLSGAKPYFLAPAYTILFAAGAVAFERLRLRPRPAWVRPAYVGSLALAGVLLAPAVMPILPPGTVVRVYRAPLTQALADRLGWDGLTESVERVYAGLDPAQRARACVLTSNYGEAGALEQLAAPGRLPPVISGHNNYYLWGPAGCTGRVLILVGYPLAEVQRTTAHAALAATHRCEYCVAFERDVPIVVVSDPEITDLARLWPSLMHFS